MAKHWFFVLIISCFCAVADMKIINLGKKCWRKFSNSKTDSYTQATLLIQECSTDTNQLKKIMDCVPAEWYEIMPNTMRSVQKNAELHQTAPESNFENFLYFFSKHTPITPRGWEIFYKSLTAFEKTGKNKDKAQHWKHLFLSKLKYFVQTADISKKNFTAMLNDFGFLLHKEDFIENIKQLLWNNNVESAKEFSEILDLPKDHWLWFAIRFLTKDAYKNDFSVMKDYELLSIDHQKLPIMQMAIVKFFIRASNAANALSVWQNSKLAVYHDNLHKSAKTSLDKLMLAVMREQIQEGNRYRTLGEEKQAKKYYQDALMAGQPRRMDSWAEFLWLQGFAYLEGLKEPKKALARFLFLAKYPNFTKEDLNDLASLPSEFIKSHDEEKYQASYAKNLVFPNKTKYRYQARGCFWAGLCYEKLGEKARAKACFEKAANYGFFFYGQMAQYKLHRKHIAMKFAQVDSNKGFKSPAQQEILQIIKLWNNQCAGQCIKMKRAKNLICDITALAETPEDKKKALELVKILDPISATHTAKSFTFDPKSTFAEAYPKTILPIPGPRNDDAIVYAITLAETCFNPSVISSAGAIGIMQIMPHEAEKLAKQAGLVYSPNKLLNGEYNTRLGIAELNNKLNKYENYIQAIAAYNAGNKKVAPWIENIPNDETIESSWAWIESMPYEETRGYVPRVLENRMVYRWLLGKPVSSIEIPGLFYIRKR